ncbi:hypothetical protein CULT_10227 [[Clostridium] ultunense Esp]|nr:hypothetical protein CULT_10227 [[Clostridium] ultunense Esp]
MGGEEMQGIFEKRREQLRKRMEEEGDGGRFGPSSHKHLLFNRLLGRSPRTVYGPFSFPIVRGGIFGSSVGTGKGKRLSQRSGQLYR